MIDEKIVCKRIKQVRKHLNIPLTEISKNTNTDIGALHRVENALCSTKVFIKVLNYLSQYVNLNCLFNENFNIDVIQSNNLIHVSESIIENALKTYKDNIEKELEELNLTTKKAFEIIK